jgi:hypothetical protein
MLENTHKIRNFIQCLPVINRPQVEDYPPELAETMTTLFSIFDGLSDERQKEMVITAIQNCRRS